MPRAVSVIARHQFQNLFESESSKYRLPKFNWKISEQRHVLLFSFDRCIVVNRFGAGWQGVCVWGGGGGKGVEK